MGNYSRDVCQYIQPCMSNLETDADKKILEKFGDFTSISTKLDKFIDDLEKGEAAALDNYQDLKTVIVPLLNQNPSKKWMTR